MILKERPQIKKWKLTSHASQRIKERNISMHEIEEIINSPDEILIQGTKYILAKNLKNRKDNMIATVVIEKKEHNLWLIITVMINFQKY